MSFLASESLFDEGLRRSQEKAVKLSYVLNQPSVAT